MGQSVNHKNEPTCIKCGAERWSKLFLTHLSSADIKNDPLKTLLRSHYTKCLACMSGNSIGHGWNEYWNVYTCLLAVNFLLSLGPDLFTVRSLLFCYSNFEKSKGHSRGTHSLVSLLSTDCKLKLNCCLICDALSHSLCKTTDVIGIDIVSHCLYSACTIMVIAKWLHELSFSIYKRKRKVKEMQWLDRAMMKLNQHFSEVSAACQSKTCWDGVGGCQCIAT